MRIDPGLVLAIVFEYLIFIYYADTLFRKKRNKYFCYTVAAVGYFLYFWICVFGNVIINNISCITLNFVVFVVCYHVNAKSALFQSVLLAVLSAASEFLIAFMPYIGIVPNNPVTLSPTQSFILTITSKLLYLIGAMIISRALCKDKSNIQPASAGLLFIPIITIIIIMLIMKVDITSSLLSAACFLLFVINIIIFAVNQRLIVTEREKAEIEAQKIKEKIDYDEYVMLKEMSGRTAALNHDFKEHISALSSLIGADNAAARDYIEKIGKIAEPQFVEYSDNKMLNVLLSKKKKECAEKNIEFLIDPVQARLAFIKDPDVVTIFSNLLNNAIGNCERSESKKINLNVRSVNENFIVIKLENSADEKPLVVDGELKTYKGDKKLHGIGMKNIMRAIKSYDGSLYWDYNENDKIFTTTVILKK